MRLLWQTLGTPIGPLGLCADADGKLKEILFGPAPSMSVAADGETDEAAKQLAEYFKRDRKEFDLKLAPVGTEFQLAVWSELEKIPFAQTITYAELAARVGQPKAFRAVGNANGRNPIPIIIPCHRVIGSDGRLTGFAGGVDIKQRLLNLETSGQNSLFD